MGSGNTTQNRGKIIVRFWAEEAVQVSTAAITDMHEAVTQKLEGGSTARSLEAVVAKLHAFVAIADEASKVCESCWVYVGNSLYCPSSYTHTLVLSERQHHSYTPLEPTFSS
jgi:hypothetical protein